MRACESRGPAWIRNGSTGRDRWMASYMDVVTILLILFAGLSAQSSTVNARQSHREEAQPAKSASPLLHAQERLRAQGLDSRMERRGLVIALPQAILFPSGEDRISAQAVPIVSRVAEVLKTIPNRVLLVGHSDAVPIHNRRFRNNWELSAARSMRLLEMFSTGFGIPESRLVAASYGSHGPRDTNDTADGRAENRRVEIVILGDSIEAAFE